MARARKYIKKRTNRDVAKSCYFCDEKKDPYFADVEILQRFISERGKIIPRSRNGLCGKHQGKLANGIKQARFLALLPFVVTV